MTDATYELTKAEPPSPSAHVSLLVLWGDSVRAIALRDRQTLVFGRAEPAQVVIEDRSLSRTHARFAMREGGVTVEDLGSTNGTLLNGRGVVGETFVEDGDVVRLGAVEVRVTGGSGGAGPHPLRISQGEWLARLEDEIERARFFGRAGVVAVVRQGRAASPEPWLPSLRPVDRVCAYGPGLCLALLPELDRLGAVQWANRAAAAAGSCAIGMACFPTDASGGEALVSLAMAAARISKLGAAPSWAQGPDEPSDAAQAVVVSKAMQRLYELVARVARTHLPVLVLGETGSGKELVARAVHDRSGRAHKPFKALNCATIPANLLESALFGHERGAFTGAERQAPGLFEQTQGGTVFLDEVGELSAQAQAALLRVLETKRVVRVGSTREIEVDARVVAATHRDLETMVRQGQFREDLMYRLDAVTLRVPPLRERVEEIVPLARLFLTRARQLWGGRACDFSEEALYALEDYCWPGNVRQLRNVVERAVAVCEDELIEVEDLPAQLLANDEAAVADATQPAARLGGAGFRSLPDRVRAFEIELIRAAMQQAHGNQAQAARILGVPRRTLANKVHAYGLLDAW